MILRRRHISSAMFYRTPVHWTAICILAAASLAFGARVTLGYFGVV